MTAAPAHPAAPGDVLALTPVLPVVVLDDAAHAVPLARALARGGVRAVEVTLRTAAGLPAVERIAAEVPEVVVGAGTVTSAAQAEAAVAAGARFLVTPGAPEALVTAALGTGVPLLAGASTVTEVMRLLERGLEAMKLFPAEAVGGTALLRAIAGPLPGARFCPTGGITPQNAPGYLALGNVGCVGGSWLAPREALAAGDWGRVERLAAEAAALAR